MLALLVIVILLLRLVKGLLRSAAMTSVSATEGVLVVHPPVLLASISVAGEYKTRREGR